MTMQTRDQKQAAVAWKAVEDYRGKMKDLATTCKKTCTRVLTSGLGPALAFAGTKSDDQHEAVRVALATYFGKPNETELLKSLVTGPAATAEELRRKTEEAMGFLTWMARLADGKAKQAAQAAQAEQAKLHQKNTGG